MGSLKTFKLSNTINQNNIMASIKEELNDILMFISWRQFSRSYFNRSSSWIYHKLDGIDPITDSERLKLKESLLSLSERIRNCADSI